MTRILIIDDLARVRTGLAETLRLNNYDVMQAEDGMEGLSIAREHLPDLIVCDVVMPELDGFEVLRELRKGSSTASIPFIFLTGKSDPPDLRHGMELGADDYVTKPFKEHELLAAIQTRLEKRAMLEAQQREKLVQRAIIRREHEYRELAHKLYDDITQPFAGMKMSLHGLERLSAESLRAKIAEIQQHFDEVHNHMDAVVNGVWPLVLDDLGLLAGLLQLIDRFKAHSHINTDFTHRGLEINIPESSIITAYRVVEEALNNAQRHGQISRVVINAWIEDDLLRIEVIDDGNGFELEKMTHSTMSNGLVDIRERVRSIGGALSIHSEQGAGVHIFARIPLKEDQRDGRIMGGDRTLSAETSVPMLHSTGSRPTDTGSIRAKGTVLTDTIHILIAEHNHIIREGLRHLLDDKAEFTVVGEAAHRKEVLRILREAQPDVLVMGMTMSGSSTLDLVQPAREIVTGLRTLILSGHSNEMYSLESLRRGASGYVLNNIHADELIKAIRTVASGSEYWPIARKDSEASLTAFVAGDPALNSFNALTSREREVLTMIAQGNTSKQIGTILSISSRTVETHRTNIGRKLGLRTQADLVRYAAKHDLV